MTLAEAIDIVRDHNDWRRGLGKYSDDIGTMPEKGTPAQIGEALDILVAHAQKSQ